MEIIMYIVIMYIFTFLKCFKTLVLFFPPYEIKLFYLNFGNAKK